MSPGFISNVETGRCNASEETIDAICSAFGLKREWLLTGKGEMFTPGNEKGAADKSTACDRVKKVRKDAALSQPAFASRIGYSVVQVRFVEYRKIVPSNDFLLAVAVAFGISYNWLLTGEGEEKEVIKPVDEEIISWLNSHPDELMRLRLKSGLE